MNFRQITPGLLILIFLLPSFASGEENAGTGASWQDYRLLSERNIFSRNRVKTVQQQFTQPVNIRREEIREDGFLVLRGIIRQAGRFIAFIEDNRSGEIKKVLKDGVIGKGKVRDITLDQITYELEGKSAQVKIGMTMGGEVAQAGSGFSSGFTAPVQQTFIDFSSTGNVSQPQAKTSGEDMKDILQRLKERRKKELGE